MLTDNCKIAAWNELLDELVSSQGSAMISAVSGERIEPPLKVRVFGLAEKAKSGATGAEIDVPSFGGRVWGVGSVLTLVVARDSWRYEGMCRLVDRGRVALAGGRPLRTLILRGPSLVESVQRRASYRLKTTLIVDEPVWLTPLVEDGADKRFGGELIEGQLMDASAGGVKVRVRTTPELRRRIERCERYALRLELPDGGPAAVVDARVAHLSEPRDGWTDLGMQFVRDYDVDSPAGERVRAFVEWAEREKILEQREQAWLKANQAKAG
ncbi:MAG: PilZ domain-containing protein [Planctomycetota bacterium]